MLKNKKGMTLVEIIVALGVFGLMATVFATSFTEVFKAQKMVENKDRANDFASAMGQFLFQSSTCDSSLKNKKFPRRKKQNGVIQNSTSDLVLEGFPGMGGQVEGGPGCRKPPRSRDKSVDICKGTVIDNMLRIDELTMENAEPDKTKIPKVMHDGNSYFRYTARVSLKMSLKKKDTWTSMSPRFFEIPVFTQNEFGGNIAGCSVEMTPADACDVLGSTYNKKKGACEPSAQCMMEGSFVTSRCSPKSKGCPPSKKNVYTKATRCPTANTASQSGKFRYSFVESCGKKCSRTITVNQAFYVCMKCTGGN